MADVFSKASTFTIRELTGKKRTLTLDGRALPYRPVTFSGSMRAEFTWYPGNPVATVQVLGASEKDTTINGVWKNRFLGSVIESGDPAIDGTGTQSTAIAAVQTIDGGKTVFSTALSLAQTVDDIRRQGQELEVTWDALKRRGIMVDFVQTFDRVQDITWSMTFGWISNGDPDVDAVTSRDIDLSSTVTSWSKVFNDITAAIDNVQQAREAGFVDELNGEIDAVQNGILEITDAVSSAVDGATTPTETAKRLTGVMETIKDTSQVTMDSLASTPSITNFDLTVPPAQAPFGDFLTAAKYVRDVSDTTLNARNQAARQSGDFQKRISPDLVATFVAWQGLDLRDVSTRFYGTPNDWRRILMFNGLTSPALTAGQVIFVPSAQSKADSQ